MALNKKEKNANTKEKKKICLKNILASILAGVLGFVLIVASVNSATVASAMEKAKSYSQVAVEDRLVPEKDENGDWVFITDRDFKVLHLTDVHLGGGFASADTDKNTLNAVATMITKEKPDLVIVTGDIAYPVFFQAGTLNNKSGAKEFVSLMENLGVYWTVTFGNHDTEAYSYYNREDISDFYTDEDLKYCLYQAGPTDIDGYGNHVIKIKNTNGIITQAFFMIDSHSYIKSDFWGLLGNYDNIHDNQVEWYKSQIEKMNKENLQTIEKMPEAEQEILIDTYGVVKSLAFFHIPLVELKDAWTEFADGGFKDSEDFKYIDGIIGETGRRVFCGVGEDNMFEAMLEMDSTKAIFLGHDHYNNLTASYKGIIFSCGYSVDYLAYIGIRNEGSQRGCTLITCKPDSTFDIEKFNYYSDRYDLEGFEREELAMQFEGVKYQVEEE